MKLPYFVFWTAENLKEAKTTANILIKQRLAACCSIIPEVVSIYEWEGKVEEATEAKVIIKTIEDRLEEIKEVILENAKYDIPEILFIKIDGGSESYINWLENLTR